MLSYGICLCLSDLPYSSLGLKPEEEVPLFQPPSSWSDSRPPAPPLLALLVLSCFLLCSSPELLLAVAHLVSGHCLLLLRLSSGEGVETALISGSLLAPAQLLAWPVTFGTRRCTCLQTSFAHPPSSQGAFCSSPWLLSSWEVGGVVDSFLLKPQCLTHVVIVEKMCQVH